MPAEPDGPARTRPRPMGARLAGRVISGGLLVGFVSLLALWLPIPASAVGDEAVSIESVQARIAELEASETLDPSRREAALSLYRQALENLRLAASYEAEARAFEQARAEAPRQQAQVRQRIEDLPPVDPEISFDADTPTVEIEQRLAVERAQRDSASQTLEQIGRELIALRQRPAEVQARFTIASGEQRAVAGAVATAAQAAADDVTGRARLTADRARLAALEAEVGMLEQELLSQPARVALLELQRERASHELEAASARVEAVREALSEQRRLDVARTVAESDVLAPATEAGAPALRSLVETNAELGRELSELTDEAQRAARQRAAAEQELESLRRRFESARQKVEVAGLSPALGRFLGAEQRDLPSPEEYVRASREREGRIAAAGLRGLQLDESRDFWEATQRRRAELIEPLSPDVAEESAAVVDSLIRARADLLRQLVAVNNDYLDAVTELEFVQQQLRRVAQEYRDFLSGELLWVRNESVLGPAKLLNLPAEAAAVFAPSRWLEALRVFARHSVESPLQVLAWLVVLTGLWVRSRLAARLRATSEKVGKPSEDRFQYTLQAMALTLVLAAPWALFTLMTGSQLVHGPSAGPDSAIVGEALMRVTPLLFFLLAFRWLCCRGGVAEAHFRWNSAGLVRMRRELALLAATLLPPAFVLMVSLDFLQRDTSVAFTQVLFLVIVLGLFRFLYQLLNPRHGIVEALRRRVRERPLLRWPRLWAAAAFSVPVVLGGVAIAGFMYSAGVLLDRLIATLLFVLGVVLLHGLIERWLLVMRRRLLLREALARREAARQAGESEAPAASQVTAAPGIAGEPSVDVASLDADSRQLINVMFAIGGLIGLAAIWAPVLPALFTLDGIQLWEYTQSIEGVETLRSVTLVDVLVALVIAALTIAAARSLPALVEIFLRQRRHVASGSRLAFATLTRYGIVLIGVGLALSTIGINWSKLQWLVAALGVGIGFGLQEIVANFISGLIILVERPVRVGDVVTVGDASGTVSRIQIRATTIRNWDQQELIVPNKEFITSRVVNWSLSDEIIRIFLEVGIAYGSDAEKALGLIREVADEEPAVLDEPQPLVTFESFGDNSLNLGLRCFVSSIGERLDTRTALHLAIERKLTEAGIVIAFPQRDVHLDTSRPLDIRLHGSAGPDPA